MSVVWRGVGQLDAAMSRGLGMAAEALKDEAVVRSPTDSGRLDQSAATAVEGKVAAAGFDTEYAIIQEQARSYHHDDGEAGYLESALRDLPLDQILAEQLKRAIGG